MAYLGDGPSPPRQGAKRKGRLPIVLAAVAAVVLLAGGGGVALAAGIGGEGQGTRSDPETATSPDPTPSSSQTRTPGTGRWLRIGSRATDPSLVTEDEAFGNKSFERDGREYTRTAEREDKKCGKAVRGSDLADALDEADCNQLIRASFERGDGELIGTIGVANLRHAKAAGQVRDAAKSDEAWLRPLSGSGKTSKLGRGLALGAPRLRGHYVIFTWVQYPDGREPDKDAHDEFGQFESDVIDGSNLADTLGHRMIMGKPREQ